jgi:transcriptional antiterminator RfaH
VNWYAIYTKPGAEDTVTQKLRQIGLEIFNPKLCVKKFVRKKYRTVIESLFPCYIFGRFEPETHIWLISYTRGVKKIVGGMHNPWTVAEEVIDFIRCHEKEGFVTINTEELKAGDTVEIAEGPFAGLSGIFHTFIKGSERVLLLLNALEFQARVVIDRASLRKV